MFRKNATEKALENALKGKTFAERLKIGTAQMNRQAKISWQEIKLSSAAGLIGTGWFLTLLLFNRGPETDHGSITELPYLILGTTLTGLIVLLNVEIQILRTKNEAEILLEELTAENSEK